MHGFDFSFRIILLPYLLLTQKHMKLVNIRAIRDDPNLVVVP